MITAGEVEKQFCSSDLEQTVQRLRFLAIRALARMYCPQERITEDRTKFGSPILQVEVVGQAASLELDGALLEPVS